MRYLLALIAMASPALPATLTEITRRVTAEGLVPSNNSTRDCDLSGRCDTTTASVRVLPVIGETLTSARGLTSLPVGSGDYAVPAAIADTLDFAAETQPAWGDGSIPTSAAPDVVGAFRFSCTAGQVLADDPVVYPGQPGASHLHQFFGNTGVNAATTYATLRTTGRSTCGSALNRSGYWQPAMVARDGSVLKPSGWAIYYKRVPGGGADCARRAKACVPIPTGIRFIYGYDMLTGTPATGSIKWLCVQNGGNSVVEAATMTGALVRCPNGAQLEARLEAPDCWDGVNVDSANHRSHIAYGFYRNNGYQCPSTHPVNIPQFTNASIWTVTDALRTASLSSDMGKPQGATFHADYFEGWNPAAKAVWEANCINKLLNCSGGDLGNGRQLKGAQ